ncbi:MAG: DUF3284 domain-containing protein [Thomasclavelia sp.]|nr:DUF3284 domain-containing protein [Thomasclavelia sp.]
MAKINSLKYSKSLECKIEDVFQTVINQQLKYFQFYDSKVKELEVGLKIKKSFYTKTTRENIEGSIKVTKLEKNQLLELKCFYGKNIIIQTFSFEENDGYTLVTYQEQNIFNKKRESLNFSLITIVYRFMFKHKMKKRMNFIEDQTKLMIQGV